MREMHLSRMANNGKFDSVETQTTENEMLKIKKLNDGTRGYRWAHGIVRRRLSIKRWGIVRGKTFTAIHAGRNSLYIERRMPRKRLGQTFV